MRGNAARSPERTASFKRHCARSIPVICAQNWHKCFVASASAAGRGQVPMRAWESSAPQSYCASPCPPASPRTHLQRPPGLLDDVDSLQVTAALSGLANRGSRVDVTWVQSGAAPELTQTYSAAFPTHVLYVHQATWGHTATAASQPIHCLLLHFVCAPPSRPVAGPLVSVPSLCRSAVHPRMPFPSARVTHNCSFQVSKQQWASLYIPFAQLSALFHGGYNRCTARLARQPPPT